MAQVREDDNWLGWRVHSGRIAMALVPCTHLGRPVWSASCSLVKERCKQHSEQGARTSAPSSALLRRGMRRPSSRALEARRRDADPSRGASAVKSWRRRTRLILLGESRKSVPKGKSSWPCAPNSPQLRWGQLFIPRGCGLVKGTASATSGTLQVFGQH